MAKITRANLQEYFDKIEAQMQLMDDVVEFNFPDNDEKEQADKMDMVNCMAYDWACRNMIENSWLIEAFTVYATLSICPDVAKPYLVSYCVDSPLWAHVGKASEADFAHFVRCVT